MHLAIQSYDLSFTSHFLGSPGNLTGAGTELFVLVLVLLSCDAGAVARCPASWLSWWCDPLVVTEDLIWGGGELSVAPEGSGLKEGCCGLGLRAGFCIPVLAQSIPVWTFRLWLAPSLVRPFFEFALSRGWDWLHLF